MPRKARPDGTFPSREELLTINLKVTLEVAEGIKQYCPDAMIISIANPLDAIVFTLDKRLSPPKNKLMGMAGVLDSGRYCYFVAEAANVSVENVNAMVLGGHGDDMVPVRSSCQIAGIPVAKFLDAETLAKIEARTRKAGGEVVGLLGFGSAFVSPAWAALEMAEAIIFDKRKILPVCAKLEGEYGVNGLFVGVPAIIGAERRREGDRARPHRRGEGRIRQVGRRRRQDLRRGRRDAQEPVAGSGSGHRFPTTRNRGERGAEPGSAPFLLRSGGSVASGARAHCPVAATA